MSFEKVMKKGITSTETPIYTCPAGNVAVIFSGSFANTSEESVAYINLKHTSGSISTMIFSNIPVMYGSTQLLVHKPVLNVGDTLSVWTDTITSGKIDLNISILLSSI